MVVRLNCLMELSQLAPRLVFSVLKKSRIRALGLYTAMKATKALLARSVWKGSTERSLT